MAEPVIRLGVAILLLATIAVSEAQQRSGKIAHIGFLGIDRSAALSTS
jgi:hypothetical protein